jgi:phenylpropionate dioxygenase-like ring-hydroxylating dioxygenase large terminal subunit
MTIDFSFHGPSVNESSALPKHFFTDPKIYDLEKDKVFRSDWVAVARVDQLINPGDYLTYDFFGDPIILACNKQGQINAFSNVCLHRACPIASGTGNTKTLFTCPYHKWTYDLEGRFRGAPDMEQAVNFNRDMRLPSLKVELWQGWVFVNASKNPEPLAPTISELEAKLAPWNVASLKTVGVLKYDSPWNWKVLLENFVESYHHMGPHNETLNPIYPHSGTYAEETNGNYTLLENPTIDKTLSPSFWVGLVFPSMMFAMIRQPNAPIIAWYQMITKSVDQFELNIHVLAPQTLIDSGHTEETLATYQMIHGEDIPICDSVWQGLQSTQYTPGRLSHLEGCIWYFHEYLQRKLSAV